MTEGKSTSIWLSPRIQERREVVKAVTGYPDAVIYARGLAAVEAEMAVTREAAAMAPDAAPASREARQ